ncbi:Coq4 family protein [Hellea sp.]|nr:Coq4 family protein [Hellea sp.]
MTTRRIRPLKAYKHFRKLVEDKEDTTQVFHIIKSLDGSNIEKDFARFMKTAEGQARFTERKDLVPLLDNHAELRKLPAGSVGQHYCDFMESQGLSAQGLVDEYDRFGSSLEDYYDDDIVWYGNRRRDVHDLFHIMTGYSRDALGEACVLSFTHSQHGGLGIYFISHMVPIEIRKEAPKGAPVWKAVREAKKNGNLAENIMKQDIMALLAENLDEARQRLNIKPAVQYHRVHQILQESGIDPFGVITVAA